MQQRPHLGAGAAQGLWQGGVKDEGVPPFVVAVEGPDLLELPVLVVGALQVAAVAVAAAAGDF
jgi:hypothetical protein